MAGSYAEYRQGKSGAAPPAGGSSYAAYRESKGEESTGMENFLSLPGDTGFEEAEAAQRPDDDDGPSLLDTFERVMGRTGRNLAVGVGQVGDFARLLGDPLARGVGAAVSTVAPETGIDIYRSADAPPASEVVTRGYDAATGGEYQPRNKMERYTDTASQFVTQAGTVGAGAAGALSKSASPMAKAAGRFFEAGGVPGMGGAAGAGAGLEYGKDEFPDNPLAQAALSTAAAVAGGGAASLTNATGRAATNSKFMRDQSGAVPLRASQAATKSGKPGTETLSKAKTLVFRALTEEQGYTPKEAAGLVKKAGKGELPLTLPELADNLSLLRYEKRLRQNAGPGGKIEGDFLRKRTADLPGAIDSELQKVVPNYPKERSASAIGKISSPDVAGREAAGAAKDILKRGETIRAEKARPFYEAAYNQRMDAVTPQMLLKNPVVARSYKAIEADPVWQAELAKYPGNSLGRFDLVKRHIDDQIEGAMRSGEKAKARILVEAKGELVKGMKEISPMYDAALRTFSKNSPKVERLQKSIVGVLADMDTGDFASAGKKLFASTPTEIRYARRVFSKHSDDWSRLVATHISDIGEQANHSPLKMLNALSSKTASGSAVKENRLDAALSPQQRQAKNALFDSLERMTRIRGGSDTAENLATDAQMDEALMTGVERAARGVTSLRNIAKAPEAAVGKVYDWFTLGVRSKNYEELARIFTGEGSEEFAEQIMRAKPGSPTAYKLIATRIGETGKAGGRGAVTGDRSAASQMQSERKK